MVALVFIDNENGIKRLSETFVPVLVFNLVLILLFAKASVERVEVFELVLHLQRFHSHQFSYAFKLESSL